METQRPLVCPAHEIACDESGWEGANLITGNSDVIAYASVRLSHETAAECMRELSGRTGRPHHRRDREYKASHVLRADQGSAVTWLLGPAGPLHGKALVHLTEKVCFVVGRVVDFFLGRSADTASAGLVMDQRLAGLTRTLCRKGPETLGEDGWRAFLEVANAVLRTRKPLNVHEPVDAFVDVVETLQELDDGGSGVRTVLKELSQARSVGYAAREHLLETRVLQPVLEPLIPALARTILHWGRGGADISIVHDEQSALTVGRVRRLERQLLPPGRSVHLRQVDSRTDPRVQVADVLAGVARRTAADALRGSGDVELGELLRDYVDPASRWCDVRSWARLRPGR